MIVFEFFNLKQVYLKYYFKRVESFYHCNFLKMVKYFL